MGQTLTEIAQKLKDAKKTVQLIYAFNGTGKTRLSRELKELIDPKAVRETAIKEGKDRPPIKFIYYNAFTEDLFFWDNDLDEDKNIKLLIRPNGFTELAFGFLQDEGQDANIVSNFQRYTSQYITPKFSEDLLEVTFSMRRSEDDSNDKIKISKGEESNFIWCVFYSLIEHIVKIKKDAGKAKDPTVDYESELKRHKLNDLEYIFIDDPVSSLDDNHLIELAVDVAKLVKSSPSKWKYVITTHNPLFYNVLFNEFNGKKSILKTRFDKLEDGTYLLNESKDSPFSYHLLLLSELEKAIESNDMQRYHFNFLRNILEKTSTFLGYASWQELLPEKSREAYYNRIINLYSHSKHSGEELAIVRDDDKRMLSFLVREIKRVYGFKGKVNK